MKMSMNSSLSSGSSMTLKNEILKHVLKPRNNCNCLYLIIRKTLGKKDY